MSRSMNSTAICWVPAMAGMCINKGKWPELTVRESSLRRDILAKTGGGSGRMDGDESMPDKDGPHF